MSKDISHEQDVLTNDGWKTKIELIRELAESGLSDGPIAAKVGLKAQRVKHLREENDIKPGREYNLARRLAFGQTKDRKTGQNITETAFAPHNLDKYEKAWGNAWRACGAVSFGSFRVKKMYRGNPPRPDPGEGMYATSAHTCFQAGERSYEEARARGEA